MSEEIEKKEGEKEEIKEELEPEKTGDEPEKKEEPKSDEKKREDAKKSENKILRNFLLIIGVVVVAFAAWTVISNVESSFDYRNIDFAVVEEIAPYRTNIFISHTDSITGAVTKAPYYIYLRLDPRENEVPFNGDLILMKLMVINSTTNLNCEGKGVIGVANLVRLYNAIGVEVMRDLEAKCDEQGRYTFLEIEEGEKTFIEQTGPNCFRMNVNNCEMLEATERMMIETLVEVNKLKDIEIVEEETLEENESKMEIIIDEPVEMSKLEDNE